jgi:hypothetical protein
VRMTHQGTLITVCGSCMCCILGSERLRWTGAVTGD